MSLPVLGMVDGRDRTPLQKRGSSMFFTDFASFWKKTFSFFRTDKIRQRFKIRGLHPRVHRVAKSGKIRQRVTKASESMKVGVPHINVRTGIRRVDPRTSKTAHQGPRSHRFRRTSTTKKRVRSNGFMRVRCKNRLYGSRSEWEMASWVACPNDMYRGTSLIKNGAPLGPFGPRGGALFYERGTPVWSVTGFKDHPPRA